jgi:ribosome-interacting GTPase 1
MLLICLDAMKSMNHKKLIERELDGFGIRLNQEPPDLTYKKKDKGGLNYQEVVPQVYSLAIERLCVEMLLFHTSLSMPRVQYQQCCFHWRHLNAHQLRHASSDMCYTRTLSTLRAVPCLRQSHLTHETCLQILREYKVHSADVLLRTDITVDQFIDVVEGNRKYMPALYVMNKIDQVSVHVRIHVHHALVKLLCDFQV